MIKKFPILGSSRFQAVCLIGFLEILVLFNVIDGDKVETLTRIFETVIGTAVAIRTADRIPEVIAEKK